MAGLSRDYRCANLPTKVKIYDVEKKELIAEFENANQASKFCGIPGKYIRQYVRSKSRCYKNSLNKVLAFR